MARKPSKNKRKNKTKKYSAAVKKLQAKRAESAHKSFKRSYREDYKKELEVPGIMHHILEAFGTLLKNWKLFLPLLVFVVIVALFFVGIMSEETYQQYQKILDQAASQGEGGGFGVIEKAGLLLASTVSTGGLAGDSGELVVVFGCLIFLTIWLVTVYFIRMIKAEKIVRFRDGLYNAMTPLIPTLFVLVVAIIECVPIFLLIIAYSAAVETEFLAEPFYALLFFVFAVIMILISGYLLSSSLMALSAVTVPGMYPLNAINAASDMMVGSRMKFIVRLVALVVTIVLMWVIVMLPLILFDLWMKQFEWTTAIPFVPFMVLLMTCFTGMYVSAYLYIYYRYMLEA